MELEQKSDAGSQKPYTQEDAVGDPHTRTGKWDVDSDKYRVRTYPPMPHRVLESVYVETTRHLSGLFTLSLSDHPDFM